jgi:transposase
MPGLSWHRADECSRRLAKIPGAGRIGAVLLKVKSELLPWNRTVT